MTYRTEIDGEPVEIEPVPNADGDMITAWRIISQRTFNGHIHGSTVKDDSVIRACLPNVRDNICYPAEEPCPDRWSVVVGETLFAVWWVHPLEMAVN